MKKANKPFVLAILITTVIILVTSCYKENRSYTDIYSSKDLFLSVANNFNTEEGFMIFEDDIILEFTDNQLEYLENYVVVKAKNSKNINEVGIFKVKNDYTNEMKKLIEQYVTGLQQSYKSMNYFPEEIEKIDFSTVKIFGKYVIYSFLNENDTESFYKDIENNLIK